MGHCGRDCNENQGRRRCPTCPEPTLEGRLLFRIVWSVVAVGIVCAVLLTLSGCGGGGDTGAEPERVLPDVQVEPPRTTLCGPDGSLCK